MTIFILLIHSYNKALPKMKNLDHISHICHFVLFQKNIDKIKILI